MEKQYDDDYGKDFDTYAKVNLAISVGSLVAGGIGKGIAKINQKKAMGIYADVKEQYQELFQIYKEESIKAKNVIKSVVILKKQIMSDHMVKFMKSYKRLAPQIRLQDSPGLGELRKFIFKQEEFQEIQYSSRAYSIYDESQLGEKASNIALLMVQDGTITNLATNIKEIIDAELHNDIELKREGIDNLKIQSIGVIGQFTPVAFEFGLSGLSDIFSSRRQINEAKEIAVQYERQNEILKINITKIQAIEQYAKLHLQLLERFVAVMDEYVVTAAQIIRSRDNIFHIGRIKESRFTENELEVLAFTFSLAGAVKAVIDSPIIAQNGEVYNSAGTGFEIAENSINIYEKKYLELSNSISS